MGLFLVTLIAPLRIAENVNSNSAGILPELLPLTPQRYAAQKACFVGNDFDILAGLEVDLLGVAAAEVEVVPVEELGGLLDRFLQQLVPVLLAVLVEAAPAEVVLVLRSLFQG